MLFNKAAASRRCKFTEIKMNLFSEFQDFRIETNKSTSFVTST